MSAALRLPSDDKCSYYDPEREACCFAPATHRLVYRDRLRDGKDAEEPVCAVHANEWAECFRSVAVDGQVAVVVLERVIDRKASAYSPRPVVVEVPAPANPQGLLF